MVLQGCACASAALSARVAGWAGRRRLPRTLRRPSACPHLQVRSLRREAAQTQEALLQSCSTFSRALAIPSPIGPFSSFPPQP